jgi:hypothetical protein
VTAAPDAVSPPQDPAQPRLLAVLAMVQGSVDVAMNLAGAAAGIVAGVLVTVSSYALLGAVAVVVTVPFLLVAVRSASAGRPAVG